MSSAEIFTIGHSNLSPDEFFRRLGMVKATALADVRSFPFSRRLPQFNKDSLQSILRQHNISYVFMGEELGGRPKLPSLYSDGIANYEAMARTPEFERGLLRLSEGALKHRIVLMCSEREPLDCHRCLLVGRALAEAGKKVFHITGESVIEDHADTEARLLTLTGVSGGDLFLSHRDRLVLAYRQRAKRVAFADQSERGSE